MGTHGGAYRRRQPEGTVLYEAVRENLATLLGEASEVGETARLRGEDPGHYLRRAALAAIENPGTVTLPQAQS